MFFPLAGHSVRPGHAAYIARTDTAKPRISLAESKDPSRLSIHLGLKCSVTEGPILCQVIYELPM
jgi:hypothetical protein